MNAARFPRLRAAAIEWLARPGPRRWLDPLWPEASGWIAAHASLWPCPRPPAGAECALHAGARRFRLDAGVHGLAWGAQGPRVLLVHGWDGRPTQFAELVPALLAAGRQVFALQAPGHGPGDAGPSHVLRFAEALRATIAQLGPVEAVVGHSMGGAAALLAAADGAAAGRIITLAAPSSLARALDRSAQRLALPPRAKLAFRRRIDAALGQPAEAVDVASRAAGLRRPVLVVHDRDDRHVPISEAYRLACRLPGARLLRTEGLRHAGVLADPAVANAIAGFITAPERPVAAGASA